MSDKRPRTNFTSFEKNFLVELVKENPLILSKQKDSSTNHQKDKAWLSILTKFNSDENVIKRDLDSLKACLANLQAKAKKEDAAVKSSMKKTGGGPSSSVHLSSTSATLVELMPQVFNSLSVLDCDEPGRLQVCISIVQYFVSFTDSILRIYSC
jgi:hypothetical protein